MTAILQFWYRFEVVLSAASVYKRRDVLIFSILKHIRGLAAKLSQEEKWHWNFLSVLYGLAFFCLSLNSRGTANNLFVWLPVEVILYNPIVSCFAIATDRSSPCDWKNVPRYRTRQARVHTITQLYYILDGGKKSKATNINAIIVRMKK